MFDLKELDRWHALGKERIKFLNPEPRKVRLEVNAEGAAAIFVEIERKRYFIGVFEGYDVVQFQVPGVFSLTAEGGPVKVWTTEFDRPAVEIPDAVSFTRIAARRTRNPELEKMMHKMNQNLERRLALIERDADLRVMNERRQAANQREADRRAREAQEAAERAGGSSGPDEVEDEATEPG